MNKNGPIRARYFLNQENGRFNENTKSAILIFIYMFLFPIFCVRSEYSVIPGSCFIPFFPV